MVAVGALIAHLAENGRLSHFRMDTESLKKKVLPTTEYIGIILEVSNISRTRIPTSHSIVTHRNQTIWSGWIQAFNHILNLLDRTWATAYQNYVTFVSME